MSEENEISSEMLQIYYKGAPEDGQAMTADDVSAALADGRLSADDLVKHDGVWRRMGDIYAVEDAGRPDYTDESLPEIAVRLKQMEPCVILKSDAPRLSEESGESFVTTIVASLKTMSNRTKGILAGVAAVLVLIALVFMFGSHVINKLCWHPAYILVVNPYDTPASVEFEEGEYALPGGKTVTIPDIFGRMPRKTSLRFISEPNHIDRTIPLQLQAGQIAIVNPNASLTLAVKNRQATYTQVSQAETRLIVEELMAGENPETALRLAERVREEGRRAVSWSTAREVLYSTDAEYQQHGVSAALLGLQRSEDDIRESSERGRVKEKPSKQSQFLRVGEGLDLGGLKASYRVGTTDVVSAEIPLLFPTFDVAGIASSRSAEYTSCAPIGGRALCSVTFENNLVIVRVIFTDAKDVSITRFQRELYGRWQYEARFQTETRKWTWKWRYTGKQVVDINGKSIVRSTLNVTIPETKKFDAIFKENR